MDVCVFVSTDKKGKIQGSQDKEPSTDEVQKNIKKILPVARSSVS
jgi:hypothetical protein